MVGSPDSNRQSARSRRPALRSTEGGLGRLVLTLRLLPESWAGMAPGRLLGPAITVGGAWLVLAWSRLGPQALFNPKTTTSFVLVGVHGWLGLSLGLWLVARLLGPRWGQRRLGLFDFEQLTRLVGLAHQPMVVAAVALLFLQIIPVGVLRSVIAAAALLLWMPGQLVAAVAQLWRRPVRAVALPTLMVWSLWLATAGRYLMVRLSHVV